MYKNMMKKLKRSWLMLKKSKTMFFGFALVIAGALEMNIEAV